MNNLKTCPGLDCSARGIFWRNSLGQECDLSKEGRFAAGEVALLMNRSAEWVLRQVRAGELYPVITHNQRSVEIYGCAVADYYARHTQGASVAP